MRETIRHNIRAPYSLHDMNVIAFQVNGDDILMRTQSGMVKTGNPCRQIDGYVEFHDVQWDFSYVYLLGVTGNVGTFTGEKLSFRDFIDYLNRWAFPEYQSKLIKGLGCCDYAIPPDYQHYPQYNF